MVHRFARASTTPAYQAWYWRRMTPEYRRGLLFGLGAFLLWGVTPIYWHTLSHVPSGELVALRVLCSLPVFWMLAHALDPRGTQRGILRRPRTMLALFAASVLLAANQLLFVIAVASNHLVEVSLGYFINPLVNVIFGMTLGERLRPTQWIATGLAAIGVVWMSGDVSGVPWIALGLALSFALYGLLRKLTPVPSLSGSTIETLFMVPFAIAFLVWVGRFDGGTLARGNRALIWLLLCGVIGAVPLWLFAAAAQRIKLSTIGFLQFIAPSMQFLSGVFLFHESLSRTRLIGFIWIWIAGAIFVWDSWRFARNLGRRT